MAYGSRRMFFQWSTGNCSAGDGSSARVVITTTCIAIRKHIVLWGLGCRHAWCRRMRSNCWEDTLSSVRLPFPSLSFPPRGAARDRGRCRGTPCVERSPRLPYFTPPLAPRMQIETQETYAPILPRMLRLPPPLHNPSSLVSTATSPRWIHPWYSQKGGVPPTTGPRLWEELRRRSYLGSFDAPGETADVPVNLFYG